MTFPKEEREELIALASSMRIPLGIFKFDIYLELDFFILSLPAKSTKVTLFSYSIYKPY